MQLAIPIAEKIQLAISASIPLFMASSYKIKQIHGHVSANIHLWLLIFKIISFFCGTYYCKTKDSVNSQAEEHVGNDKNEKLWLLQ